MRARRLREGGLRVGHARLAGRRTQQRESAAYLDHCASLISSAPHSSNARTQQRHQSASVRAEQRASGSASRRGASMAHR